MPNFSNVMTSAQEGKLGDVEQGDLTSIFTTKKLFSNCFYVVGIPSSATTSLANSAWGNSILASKEYLWLGGKLNMQYNLPVNTAGLDNNVLKAGVGGGYVVSRNHAEMVKFFMEE